MENHRKSTSDIDRNKSEKQVVISDLEIIQKSLDDLREALSRQQSHVARDFEERVRHVYDDVINDISLIRDRVTSISSDITRGATSKPAERFQYRKDLIKRVRNDNEPRGKLKASKSFDFVDAKEFDLPESRSTEHLSDNPPIGQRLCRSSASIYTKDGRRKVSGYGCCFTGDGKTLPYRSYRPWYSLFRSPSEIWNLGHIESRSKSLDDLDLTDGSALCGDVTDDWRVKVAPYMWDGWEVPGLDKTEVGKMKLRLEHISIIRDDVAEVHNEYRRKHGVPEVRVSPRLAKDAQKWAETLALIGYPQYSNTPNRGENILVVDIDNELTGRQVVDTWYREGRHYKYSDTCWQRGTSNFTQLIWKSTNQIGVGVAKHPYHDSYIVVVQYTPPGNFNTEEDFRQNVFPSLKSKGVRFRDSSDDTNTRVMEPFKYNSASPVYHERGLYNRSSHNVATKSDTQEKSNESSEFNNTTIKASVADQSDSNIFSRDSTNERLETKFAAATNKSSTHNNARDTEKIKGINATKSCESKSRRTNTYDSSEKNKEKETVDATKQELEEQWIRLPIEKIPNISFSSTENVQSGKGSFSVSNSNTDIVDREHEDNTITYKNTNLKETIKDINATNSCAPHLKNKVSDSSTAIAASQRTLTYDSCEEHKGNETVYAKQQKIEEQWVQMPLEKIPLGQIASTENVYPGKDSFIDSNLNTQRFETELDENLTSKRLEVDSTTTKLTCSDNIKSKTLAFDEHIPMSINHNGPEIKMKDANSVHSSNLELREDNCKSNFKEDQNTERQTEAPIYDANDMNTEKCTKLPNLNKTTICNENEDAKVTKQSDSQIRDSSKHVTGISKKEINTNERNSPKRGAAIHNDRCGSRMTYVSEIPSQHAHASKIINEDDVTIYDHIIFVQKDKSRSPSPARIARDNESRNGIARDNESRNGIARDNELRNADNSKASVDETHHIISRETARCKTSQADKADEFDKNSDPSLQTVEQPGHRNATKEQTFDGKDDLEKIQTTERKEMNGAEVLEHPPTSPKISNKDMTDYETNGGGRVLTYHVATLRAGPWLMK